MKIRVHYESGHVVDMEVDYETPVVVLARKLLRDGDSVKHIEFI